ncbi:Transcriptional regulator, AraC family [Frankia canadensis]|uniref:Transcriptional regulator, AraC family n=1 Tax=Frankia canadensis TaxID=1836972 RepID=A0A2I2L1K6_9ACTN|nr:AraC family transcriptional regulator [Frankia canadensis]SNQ51800.1 Transcriptional regulator, AraC family [Frankia canadensis]SOU59090.1 Transcriptional regulator, AraC family [Frankia canadensis]
MDVLSDSVTMMRAGRPHSTTTRLVAPWGMRFPPAEGAGFHVVLRGSCWLLRSGAEPLPLSTGDIVFLPREAGHALADDPASPLIDFQPDARRPAAARDDEASRNEASGSGNEAGDSRKETGGGDKPTAGAEPCAGRAVTELLCGAYVLDQSRPHPLLADLPDVIHLPARVGRHPRLRTAVDLLGAEVAEAPQAGASASVAALLDLLLLYLLRAWFAERATGWSAALADPAISAALQAIHAEPGAPWTVRDLATRAGLSRTVFAQRFTALVGRSPLAYLTWWRMTVAARLLRETELALSAVAARCGYSSEFAFAKTFKRELGIPPGQFRRRAEPRPTDESGPDLVSPLRPQEEPSPPRALKKYSRISTAAVPSPG